MAELGNLVGAIRDALDGDPEVGRVFDTYAGPNLTEDDFPVVVFSIAVGVTTHFPGAAGAVDQITGSVLVYHHTLAAEGTAAMRDIADRTQAALHQSNLTATGWRSIQCRLVSRSPIEAIGEGMYQQVDTYNLIGEPTL